ncbi:hypothetical protein BpHYR1_017391, partial [Brachionus plicatilis]
LIGAMEALIHKQLFCRLKLIKSLIFILTVIINVQAESHIFHKRNVDLRTEIYGMKTNAILFHTNLHCVFFIHFMPSIIFNIVPTLFYMKN